ncbi:MAG TPA: amino acid ABC transporter substrate-binding protein [Stellaceae bacterium]|nr:amino acid ABC transporter substrate-binding protein [Stellaceae bacterium]
MNRRQVLAGLAGTLVAPRAFAQGGTPIRVGQTLSLTGPLSQTGLVHQIVGEIFVARLNADGGLLGRKVEYVLRDDQSKPETARTLYEQLITSDKVDLILGPYGTSAILAAMPVAERNHKLFIESSLGRLDLASYPLHFAATTGGYEGEHTFAGTVLDAYASTGQGVKTIAIVTSKFPSAQLWAQAMQEVAKGRGITVVQYLEYDFGTHDFGAIAARVKDADPDLMWVGALGVDGNLLLEAAGQLGYKPRRHFYLFPSSGPMALLPAAENATSMTNFEDIAPFTSNPAGAAFAADFRAKAEAAKLPYPHADSQAGYEYAAWQILTAAVEATKSLDDATLAQWLDHATVDTVVGRRDFSGKYHTSGKDLEMVRQLQHQQWVAVWPTDRATPGAKLIAP